MINHQAGGSKGPETNDADIQNEYLELEDSSEWAAQWRGEGSTRMLQHDVNSDLAASTKQQKSVTTDLEERNAASNSAILDTGASW